MASKCSDTEIPSVESRDTPGQQPPETAQEGLGNVPDKLVTAVRDDPNQGGYDCSLVDPPPEHLQTECSVCLCLLRDPHLVDCCGYSFCQTCIESIQARNKPCPLCNVQFTTVVPDKRLQRQLNGLQVYCSHKQAGCEWVGELGALRNHLNIDVKDNQTNSCRNGCKFVLLPCTHCDKKFRRQNIEQHEKEQCPSRPYSCDYCHNYASTCEDVTVNHWPVCGSRPVPCPNECGVYPEHKDLENHVSEKCPLQVVNCDFDYAGCDKKLPRQDMPEHINSSLSSHMSLLAINHKKQMQENESLVKEIQLLKQEVKVLTSIPPVQFTMEGFEQRKKNKEKWFSSPFYSHPQGYKLCLAIRCTSDWHPEHIGVFVHILKGEFDNTLKWPFNGYKIEVVLVNQDNCWRNLSKQVTIRQSEFGRVVEGDKSERGRGIAKFIDIKNLSILGQRYLVNDTLHFCVAKIKLLQDSYFLDFQ